MRNREERVKVFYVVVEFSHEIVRGSNVADEVTEVHERRFKRLFRVLHFKQHNKKFLYAVVILFIYNTLLTKIFTKLCFLAQLTGSKAESFVQNSTRRTNRSHLKVGPLSNLGRISGRIGWSLPSLISKCLILAAFWRFRRQLGGELITFVVSPHFWAFWGIDFNVNRAFETKGSVNQIPALGWD